MPLTKEKAIELVTRIDYDAEIKQKFLARLESDLFSSHESFASNSLLLSIMLMTFDNFADIPQKRHIFYSNAFDTLYSIHDATKGGYKRNLKSHLSSQEFKKVFSCFCFISYLGATTEFSRDKLNSYLDAVVNKPASFDKDAFIDDLTSSVCLIYIEGTNYIFTHKSFQEYFAALYLLQMNDEEQKNASIFLLENCENTLKTDSVFEMLSDMNPDRFEQNFVLPLLQQICSLVPEDCTDNRKIFQAFINKIIITSIKNLHHISDSEFEHIFILPLLCFEKNDNLICISFKKGIHPNFLFFLGTHYNEKADFQITINKNHKLPTKYFAKEYQASAVANDPTLFNYVMNIYLVNTIVTTPIPLLKQIKDRQEQKKNDETKLFMRFLSIGSDD